MKNAVLWLILAIIWGSSYFAIKIGVETIPAFTLVALRMAIGSLFLMSVVYIQGYRFPIDLRSVLIMLIPGLIGNAIPFTLISNGEVYVDSGLASLMMGLVPVIVIMLAPIMFDDEGITGRAYWGILFAMVGLVVLVGPSVLSGIGDHILAQLAILASSFLYASTTLFVKKFSKIEPIVMAAGSMMTATIVMIFATILVDWPVVTIDPSMSSLLSALYLGFFPTAIAMWIYFYLLPQIGASRLAQLNFVVPVVGTLLGVFVLGEPFDYNIMIAMVMIVAAVYMVSVKPKA